MRACRDPSFVLSVTLAAAVQVSRTRKRHRLQVLHLFLPFLDQRIRLPQPF